MNSLQDVAAILTEVKRIGDKMAADSRTGSTMEDAKAIFRQAERSFSELQTRVNALKLSREDRQHMRLLRKGLAIAIKANQLGVKGKYGQAQLKGDEAAGLIVEYTRRVIGNV
ncbi:hypothetical protein AABM38_10125 [Heyndrickxia sp. MSNUG]|uniref:hypothetical protein n=1 Tax=Heyndrickxia sp. MSNUG TaxID=3136677 RepID=UPI003C305821